MARYLDVIRYTFKLTWMALGITVLAEVTGKTILGTGLATQLRPRKYYTVSRETLDGMIGDVDDDDDADDDGNNDKRHVPPASC